MRVEEKDVDRLNQSLSKKFRSGDKWVAYEDDYKNTVTSGVIETFKNIGAANRHCENNTGYDYYGESESRHFKFQPIVNVIKSLSGDTSQPIGAADLDRLAEQIHQHAVFTTAYHWKEPIVDVLADGKYHPVEVHQQILPWKDIESYEVNAHFYPKGMIYEIGHSRKSHGVFGSYYEAQKCFEGLMEKYARDSDVPELKLIGKIKGQELTRDFEDFPQPGTGVLFKMANPQNGEGGMKKYVPKQMAELDKPISVVQRKMAKYNLRTAVLEFFDGCLQKVAPGAKIPFMNFGSLSTSPVEIVSSMKQTVSGDEQLNQGQEKKHGLRLKPGS
jgi:hypothetical protein